jgi:FkbM family methyltransferase
MKLGKFIQNTVSRFGYELHRTPPEPFAVQRDLVTASEPVIFDVGAFIGGVTRRYRQLFPQAQIHAFEPSPQSFALLQQNAADDGRTFLHNVAVADRTGTAALNLNAFAATNSILPTDDRGRLAWGAEVLETRERLEVQTVTVDTFCRENKIPHLDILKLDIQGAEYLALTGAREMLDRQAIGLIYTEMLMTPTYQGQHPFQDYLNFLTPLGYELLDIYHPSRKRVRLIQTDIIFLNRELNAKALE